MNRKAQISRWSQQAELMVQRVAQSQQRRRPGAIGGVEDEAFARRGGLAMTPAMLSSRTALHGATIPGARDEEKSRRLPETSGGAGARLPGSPRAPRGAGISGSLGSGKGEARAWLLAAGYQPAVIKVLSYAHGVVRATKTGQYAQREDVPLETHDGRLLIDREAVADEIKVWSAQFSKRAESQDVGAVRLTLHGVKDTVEGRELYEQAITAGFSGHRHAYRLDTSSSGELEARLVVVLAGPAKERFRVRQVRIGDETQGFTQKRFDTLSESRIMDRIQEASGVARHAIDVSPGMTNHGRDGVMFRLKKLVDHGAAIDDKGKSVAEAGDIRGMAREWGPSLRSQSVRDTMHLMLSAKADTDVEALRRAARAFLQDRFADHKFMFGIHTDKEDAGHIHVHAVVAAKSESGQTLHPGHETFSEWRRVYAEHAQAEGLKIVATSACERASSQSYGPKDKAIVAAADHPRPEREARDRAYAADPANRKLIEMARHRMNVARANPIRLPMTVADRRAVGEGLEAWKAVATAQPDNVVARTMVERLSIAHTVGAILQTIGRRVDQLTRENPEMPVTSEQMAKDLHRMNEAVSRTSDLLEGETKKQFREASARYLETLANRVDLQRAQERGVSQMTRAEVEAIVGPNADRLIKRANALRDREDREAAAAQRLAHRSVKVGRPGGKRQPVTIRRLRANSGRNARSSLVRGHRQPLRNSKRWRPLMQHASSRNTQRNRCHHLCFRLMRSLVYGPSKNRSSARSRRASASKLSRVRASG
ncbi:relaxase/mobilization nuclease domain-containing protein [Bosea sp. AS-1]|uniref:relaxase/mobilization nuclease domain-containing protein n=1 Tax=Bosea sp. AS-1 TaxID=2015316 RepID=UPI0020C0C404|nr:relaxase/mobilization nuclease domain-containing protein [Bosea sp. AS-1]